ncbi:hypothetical protein [Metamycoplasma hominis]|uniref:hypothetical protein n=1 Tax=Metamycoplasma hominis TaxID=2098 RepID=UPI000DDF9C58|nr:hypothetical protein [Metamycoplasma hominis]RBI34044.1 hypothetical protein DRZ74_01450 [Metamycoplasma hominis]
MTLKQKNFRNQKKSISYWKNAWNKATISYFFVSLVIYIALIFIVRYSKKSVDGQYAHSWQNSLTVSMIFAITINFIIVVYRKGMGKWIVNPIANLIRNRIIMRRAKDKFYSGMTIHQKDIIIAKERQEFERERLKAEKQRNYQSINNLSFLLLILYGLIILIILIPFLALKIVW